MSAALCMMWQKKREKGGFGMALQSWLTLNDLAAYLGMTEAQLLQEHPGAEKTLSQIQIDLMEWIFPNDPTGKEGCLKQAGLNQWDYMQTDDYKTAWALTNGIQGFRVGNFSIGAGSSSANSNYKPERALMGALTRQILRHCGLLCRATACGRATC